MMNPLSQIIFEARTAGASLLAIFVPYQRPIGATTEPDGATCGRHYAALVESAGASAGPYSVRFCVRGQLVFLPVSNVAAALSEIWGAFARANAEDSCWVAQLQADDAWLDLIPVRGEERLLPEEIALLPGELYRLGDELAFLRAQQDELKAASEARTEQLKAGLLIDALSGDDGSAQMAHIEERLEGVRNEIAGWHAKLTGGQS